MRETRRSIPALATISCVAALLTPRAAGAAQVKGVVDAPPAQAAPGRMLGYTRMHVAGTNAQLSAKKADVAVVLSVKTSLPIPAPAEPYRVSFTGLRFVPSVAACVVDGKIAFTNDERAPITLLIGQTPFATVQPGETKTYDCTAPEPKLRRVRVKEWPHVRGAVYVGELGVAAQPGPNGAFTLTAPQGKYELQLIAEDGPIAQREVEITSKDVDVGHFGVPASQAGQPNGQGGQPAAGQPTGPAGQATDQPAEGNDQPKPGAGKPGGERPLQADKPAAGQP